MHALSVNRFLPYCWYHPIIEHLSLHLYLHHTNTYTNYTKWLVMDINKAMWSLLCELVVEKYLTFNIGDYVMVRICLKQFPSGTIKMLHARSARPFKILNKLNCNVYVIDLLRDYDISCTFNVNDLIIARILIVVYCLISLPLNYFLRAPQLVHS